MILTIIGGCLLSGAIGCGLGGKYERATAGFIWGFLLGPVGWIVILAAGDSK